MDYPNKKILQYIKFGYPLYLSNPSVLNNVIVSNHASAIQFSTAVSQYLSKESELGAILRPEDKVDHLHYYCSPILTRPKDNDKRRVILNLSHPRGASVNDNVTRPKFDGAPLRFPTIDNIVDEIRQWENPVIFKVDIARTFLALGLTLQMDLSLEFLRKGSTMLTDW